MSYIDLAKFYATEVAESNSSKKPFIYIPNNIGSFILNTALERISKTLDDIPLKQVTLEIEKIQKELGKGWEKDKKGNYRTRQGFKGTDAENCCKFIGAEEPA